MLHKLTLSDRADEMQRRAIFDPLVAFNRSRAGDPDHRLLNILVGEPDVVVGGLWGNTGWGWFYVDLLFIPEDLRGQGIGRRMMAMAEREAASRGCHGAWVDTYGWQARGFYESVGYELFGELPDHPVGHTLFFLRKSLASVLS